MSPMKDHVLITSGTAAKTHSFQLKLSPPQLLGCYSRRHAEAVNHVSRKSDTNATQPTTSHNGSGYVNRENPPPAAKLLSSQRRIWFERSLRPVDNTFFWRWAEWMCKISEWTYLQSGCVARLKKNSTETDSPVAGLFSVSCVFSYFFLLCADRRRNQRQEKTSTRTSLCFRGRVASSASVVLLRK